MIQYQAIHAVRQLVEIKNLDITSHYKSADMLSRVT